MKADPHQRRLDFTGPDFGQREILKIPEMSGPDQGEHEAAHEDKREPLPGFLQGLGIGKAPANGR